jgi:ribonuclease E
VGSLLSAPAATPAAADHGHGLVSSLLTSVTQPVASTLSAVTTTVAEAVSIITPSASVTLELPLVSTVEVSLTPGRSAEAPGHDKVLAVEIDVTLPIVGSVTPSTSTPVTSPAPVVSVPPVTVTLPAVTTPPTSSVAEPPITVTLPSQPSAPAVVTVVTPSAARVQGPVGQPSTSPVVVTPAANTPLPGPAEAAVAAGNGPATTLLAPPVAAPNGLGANVPFFDPRLDEPLPVNGPAAAPAGNELPAGLPPATLGLPNGIPLAPLNQGDSGEAGPALPDETVLPPSDGAAVPPAPRLNVPAPAATPSPADAAALPQQFGRLVDPAADGGNFDQTVQQFLDQLAEVPATLNRNWTATAAISSAVVALAVAGVTVQARRRKAAAEPIQNWYPQLVGLNPE